MMKDTAEDEQRQRIAMTRSSARARLAANGLLVDDTEDATSQLLIQDIVEAGEYDVLKLRDNYDQQIRATALQGSNFQAEASLQNLKASSYNAAFSAGGSLLSNAGKTYGAGKQAGFWS